MLLLQPEEVAAPCVSTGHVKKAVLVKSTTGIVRADNDNEVMKRAADVLNRASAKPRSKVSKRTAYGNKNAKRKVKNKKTISFGNVNISEHSMILGDHPACRYGPAVQLSWQVQQTWSMKLDDYEIIRSAKRDKTELYLHSSKRRRIVRQSTLFSPLKRLSLDRDFEIEMRARARDKSVANTEVVAPANDEETDGLIRYTNRRIDKLLARATDLDKRMKQRREMKKRRERRRLRLRKDGTAYEAPVRKAAAAVPVVAATTTITSYTTHGMTIFPLSPAASVDTIDSLGSSVSLETPFSPGTRTTGARDSLSCVECLEIPFSPSGESLSTVSTVDSTSSSEYDELGLSPHCE